MAAITRNIPYQPVFNDTWEGAAGGRLKLYESGTSTPKVAYKDASKSTSYGSTIDLDASGRPDDGPIYWDGVYKIEIYTYTNGAYVLLDTIDPYDGTFNTTVTADSNSQILNGSFETDSDSDGDPDYWDITDSGSVVALDDTDPFHGSYSLCFTGSASSADYAVSKFYPISEDQYLKLSFAIKANSANAEPKFQILWYDKDQSLLSTSTVWDGATATVPTDWEYKYGLKSDAPATACWYKLKFIANADATGYNVCIDDVRADPSILFNVEGMHTIQGMELSRDSGDTDHDITISAGVCLDSTFTETIVLPTSITKRCDASFADGDGNGAMGSGASLPSEGLIYWYAIKDTSTGRVDVFADDGDPVTGPTLPSGYDVYRYLGAWRTDSSNNLESGVHKGDHFFWLGAGFNDVVDSSLTDATVETATAVAPPHAITDMLIRAEVGGGSCNDLVLGVRPKGSAWSITYLGNGVELTGQYIDELTAQVSVYVNEDSQYEYLADWNNLTGTITLSIRITGWKDLMRNAP